MSAQPLTLEGLLEIFRESDRRFREQMAERAAEFDRQMAEFRKEMRERDAKYEREKAEREREKAERERERAELAAKYELEKAERERAKAERDAKYELEKKKRDAEYNRINKQTNKKIAELSGSLGRVIERMLAGDNILKQFKTLDYEIESYSRNKSFGRGYPKAFWGEIDLFLENGDIAILIEVKTTLAIKDIRTHMERLAKFRRLADIKGDKRRFIGAVAGAVIEEDAASFAHENGMYVIAQSGKAMDIIPTPTGFKAREW